MAEYKKIQDTENSGFGKYDEANGGGTPVGGKFGGPRGRVGWKQRGEPGHREGQPRTNDGKFTYNSVNGKGLSDTSDPTRGKTVNPLLTGGENGVKIQDVETQFEAKQGDYWDKYADKWYVNGSEKTGINTRGKVGVKVAGKTVWEVARQSYDTVKGEFSGESENWTGKAGARNKEEKAAVQAQQQTGKEQFVEEAGTKEIKRKDASAPIEKSEINNETSSKITSTAANPTFAYGHMPNVPGQTYLGPGINNSIAPSIAPSAPTAGPTGPAGNVGPTTPPTGNIGPTGPSNNVKPTAGTVNNIPTQNTVAPSNTLTPSNQKVLNKMFGGNAPTSVTNNAPQNLQDFSNDANLAKINPGQFANKYRNEINAMLGIIQKTKPNFSANQLISLIGSGKLKNIDQVKKLFNAN